MRTITAADQIGEHNRTVLLTARNGENVGLFGGDRLAREEHLRHLAATLLTTSKYRYMFKSFASHNLCGGRELADKVPRRLRLADENLLLGQVLLDGSDRHLFAVENTGRQRRLHTLCHVCLHVCVCVCVCAAHCPPSCTHTRLGT